MTTQDRPSDSEVIALLRGSSLVNIVRLKMFSAAARVDQALAQRLPPSPVEVRRMELEVRRMELAAAQEVIDLVRAHPAPVLPTLDHPAHVEPHQNRRESGASSLQPLAAVAAILTTLALTAALQRPTPAGRHYHPMPLAQMAQAAPGDPILPTHVVTAGTVRMVRQEADGDLHVRLCAPADPRVCIVLECIPELPCKAPRYGDHVTAEGISRWDTAHRWQEIHPVLSLEVDK